MIALVQPGQCRRHDAVVLAQAAGVLAIVTTYAEWGRDAVRRPTLVEPDDIRIPVLAATHAVGLALAQAAADGSRVHLSTATSVRRVSSTNVIGETKGGDPAHVVMLGGHLDSVIDGPGINDNGSGTMAILEIARQAAALAARPGGGGVAWKVRVAFWAGEEIGLFGSAAYVGSLGSSGGRIDRGLPELRHDRVAERHPVRVRRHWFAAGARIRHDRRPVHDRPGRGRARLGAGGDRRRERPLALRAGGDPDRRAVLGRRRDQVGSTGHTSTAGPPMPPPTRAITSRCDTTANVDAALLEQLARAAGWAVGRLASGEVALD